MLFIFHVIILHDTGNNFEFYVRGDMNRWVRVEGLLVYSFEEGEDLGVELF